jgi:hypothetical protein
MRRVWVEEATNMAITDMVIDDIVSTDLATTYTVGYGHPGSRQV